LAIAFSQTAASLGCYRLGGTKFKPASDTTIFKGQEGIKMSATIQKGIIQEGIEIGRAEGEARGEVRGELKGRVTDIVAILRNKFDQVPQYIIGELNQRTDATAMESLVICAANCSSLKEFVKEL
jgi:hypothetical protein